MLSHYMFIEFIPCWQRLIYSVFNIGVLKLNMALVLYLNLLNMMINLGKNFKLDYFKTSLVLVCSGNLNTEQVRSPRRNSRWAMSNHLSRDCLTFIV